jgi:hypothetical protein
VDGWERRVRELDKLVGDGIKSLKIIGAIVEQLPFFFVGGAVAAGFGAWVGDLRRFALARHTFGRGRDYGLQRADGTCRNAPDDRPWLGWAARDKHFSGRDRARISGLRARRGSGRGVASSRRILLSSVLQAGGAFAGTTLVQTVIEALEAKAKHQGGESSFTEMLSFNAIMNAVGLLFGAAVHIEPSGAPPSKALPLPTPKELSATWTARGVPIDEAATKEWLDLEIRSATVFRDRYRRLAKAAGEGTLTKQQFEDWRTEGLELADELGKKLPGLAEVLGSTHTTEEIGNFIKEVRARLTNIQYTGAIELAPEFIPKLTQVGAGPTFTYPRGREPPRLSHLLKSHSDHGNTVRPLPGGGVEVTDPHGRIILQAIPASAAIIELLPPSLDVIARGAKTEEGLGRVRTQTAVPELPAQLAQAAAKYGQNPVRRLLQILARGDAPPSDRAFRGLSNFVKLGGDPRVAARAVTIAGDKTGSYANSLFEQMVAWDGSSVNGLSTIYEVRPRTTGEEIGVLLGDFPADDVKVILQSIDRLAPHAERGGLRRLIGQLMREFVPPERYRARTVAASPTQIGARSTLARAIELLRRYPGKTIDFEAPGLTPLGALRIEDIVILDPVTRERIIGFEVKEVSSAFLGPRAVKQLAADLARDAAARSRSAELGLHRDPYETFRWRIRRYEVEAQAAARLRSRGIDTPTPGQLDGEMRVMIRDNLRSTFDQPEFRHLPPAVQAEYRALFDQSMPLLEFDEMPPPAPARPPAAAGGLAKAPSAAPTAVSPAANAPPTTPGNRPPPAAPATRERRRPVAPETAPPGRGRHRANPTWGAQPPAGGTPPLASGGTPPSSGGGSPPGSPPPGGGATTPPAPPIIPVSPNMNISPRTAGTGGITGISGFRAQDGSMHGRVRSSIGRQGFEQGLVRGSDLGLADYDLLHLWGPRLGDEAAAATAERQSGLSEYDRRRHRGGDLQQCRRSDQDPRERADSPDVYILRRNPV